MLFIAIALLLMKREPDKHIFIDSIKPKLNFVLTHVVAVDFGESLSIDNNSLSFEAKVLHSIMMTWT